MPFAMMTSCTTNRYDTADATPITAPTTSANTNEPVLPTIRPVTVGANAPPRYPPKFGIAPIDAVQFVGTATELNAQAQVLVT